MIARVALLSVTVAVLFSPLLSATWIFEDARWLPVRDLPGYWWRTGKPLMWLLAAGIDQIGLGSPLGHHLVNLIIHVVTAVLVGRCAWWLLESAAEAWIAGALFLLHPLAWTAVGYASAFGELLVGLGVVTLAWLHVKPNRWSRRRWDWLAVSAVVVATLLVKTTGIVAVLVVALFRRRLSVALVFACAVSLLLWPILTWTHEVLSIPEWTVREWIGFFALQSTSVVGFALQSIVPIKIALLSDWASVPSVLKGAALIAVLAAPLAAWFLRHRDPLVSFCLWWILATIGVRIVVPAGGHLGSAPELIYAQQWYPALPGMVWLMVGIGRRVLPR